MAINYEIRKLLPPDSIVFDNHSYDNSIIGVTLDGRAIYCFERMIEEFREDEDCDYLEAVEWIEYNTLRALPYIKGKRPLVVYTNE
jgi:hypothetical protein